MINIIQRYFIILIHLQYLTDFLCVDVDSFVSLVISLGDKMQGIPQISQYKP